eukprot:6813328-Prymnesium_polylepis.1
MELFDRLLELLARRVAPALVEAQQGDGAHGRRPEAVGRVVEQTAADRAVAACAEDKGGEKDARRGPQPQVGPGHRRGQRRRHV